MNQIHRYKKVVQKFENATNLQQIMPILQNMNIKDIKQSLSNVFKIEISTNTKAVSKIYFASESIIDILSLDIVQLILTNLEPKDIFYNIALLNKDFNKLTKQRNTLRVMFYCHPLFQQIFHKIKYDFNMDYEYMHDSKKMIYYLQNKYDSSILNKLCSSSSNEFKNVLIGQDRLVWQLCSVFKLKTRLLGQIDDTDDQYTNCFKDIYTNWEDFDGYSDEIEYHSNTYEIAWPDGKVIYQNDITVTAQYMYRKEFEYYVIPMLSIDIPDIPWREKFEETIESNIKNRTKFKCD